jgi:hypothetical protein
MKMKNYFQMLAVAAGMVVAAAPLSSCKDDDANSDAGDTDDENIVDVESTLPDSIKNGSDFYIIFLDEASADLGGKVKEPVMLRDYDVWPAGESLGVGDPLGVNSWGAPEEYITWVVNSWAEGWNGGGIIAILSEFEATPDLSPIMEDGFYFHFAIKSPSNQTSVGWTLIFYSEGPEISYYFGPQGGKPANVPYGGNYAHDGEWHHFEIPVSQLAGEGYSWSEPLNVNGNNTDGRRYLIGFQNPSHTVGAELNLDALFFYKKPAK